MMRTPRVRIHALLLVPLLAVPLAGTRAAGQESGSVAEADDGGLVVDYPVYMRVRPPAGYLQARAQGTRGDDGRPGPNYWQQQVNYRIEARLVPDSARLIGSESIEYINNSPDTLPGLLVHLYQNVFSAGVERNRAVQLTGGMALGRVAAQGEELRRLSRQDLQMAQRRGERALGYVVDGSLAQLALPEPLAPGDTAELEVEWSFIVPGPSGFRMGRIDTTVYNIAQWYPQIATYDDVSGYDAKSYMGDGEFYLEYGTFELAITMPPGWLVTASGALQNADAVLTSEARRRLEAATASDTVVRVVGPEDLDAGRATADSDTALTWRFRAERVRDVAFATSNRYVWDAIGAEVGGERGRVRVDAFYDPSIEHWADAAEFSKHSVEFFSDYLMPYPYPHASAAYGPVGGMEYPMLVFIGRSREGEPLYSVLAHEFSHEWFPMIVGSNEHAYAWMDEGLTTFNENLARIDYFDGSQAFQQSLRTYLQAAWLQVEAPLMEHTDYVENGFGRTVAAYSKPGILLRALRSVLGEEVFDQAYRTYAEAWAYKHPTPWDFFTIFETVAGRDLDWFWQPWFYETHTLDQAIGSVEQRGDTLRVTVTNLGNAVMPVDLHVTLEDGSTSSTRWPVRMWAETRAVSGTIPVDGRVTRVSLDPDGIFPDIDRSNNGWEAATEAAPADTTSDR